MRSEAGGVPTAVQIGGRTVKVDSVQDRWKIEEEWWRDAPVSRVYYEVVLEDGRMMTILHDGAAGRWFRQRA